MSVRPTQPLGGPSDHSDCSFCLEPARYHFGTELWKVPLAYVIGRLTIAGETLHACGKHGWELKEWAREQEFREMRHIH